LLIFQNDGKIAKQKSAIQNPQSKIAMMWYVLIGLSLSLACVAGLQFFYMLYLERISDERKKRIYELERHSKQLAKRLSEAEHQITDQNEILENMFDEQEEEEIWADVIEDR
jgi:hypothetical protein